jgi:hypothetical protein
VRASERAAPDNVDLACPAGGWRKQPSARRDDLKRIEFFRKVPFEPTPVNRSGISLSLGLVDHIDFAGQG